MTAKRISVYRLMTVKEYADHFRVTARTVQRWVAEKAVPVKQVGPRRAIRVVVDDPALDATPDDK